MNAPRRLLFHIAIAALAIGVVGLLPAGAGAATAAPSWGITSTLSPTNLDPAFDSLPESASAYEIVALNTGTMPIEGPVTVTDALPPGVSLNETNYQWFVELRAWTDWKSVHGFCEAEAPGVVCEFPNVVVPPGQGIYVVIPVRAQESLLGSTVTNEVTISGGGAPDATATEQSLVSHERAANGFHSAQTWLTDAAGAAETQAGSHPTQFHIAFQLNNFFEREWSEAIAPIRTPKESRVTLPRGFVVNPRATPVRCPEAQLEFRNCPEGSPVGVAHSYVGLFGGPILSDSEPVFNLVPQPGDAASLGFEPFALGLYIHLHGGLGTTGDYSLGASAQEIPQLDSISGFGLELWGSPSDPSHDTKRGNECGYVVDANFGRSCPVEPDEVPFLTMPSACSGPLNTHMEISSWEEPDTFISTDIPTTDTAGNPVGVSGCNALEFEPTLKARPTTNVADAPSGLEVDLHIPQHENINTLATANLRNTTVTLPPGLVVNPAAGNGLGACSAAQLGLTSAPGATPLRTSPDPATCPDAAKIGSVEVNTPLLDHTLPGAVYLAAPYENPFKSLLAIYITVHDPKTGIVVKLAGEVHADPQTGQLTATFTENPELPFEDFKLDFYGGASGTLRTPPTCGNYATTSSLEPWSAPDSGPPAEPEDAWAIEQGANGGACPATEDQQPNSPSLDAGTVTPIAGAYSPMVIDFRREDGTQQVSKVTVSTPPGLTGRLAGIPYCPEAALAAAAAKSGHDEQGSPSCPAASSVGSVAVAAGAGPAPYWATGKAYLTGPYKGAPLSLAIVTPAVAGPFDLGTVVVRTALRVDPASGQITAISDEIPHILAGIPLDIRRAVVRLDRPEFTRNGTSCNPLSLAGSLVSTFGQTASLTERFQLGECPALSFKPKLSIRLKGGTRRGGHPALTGILTMPEGGANLAGAAVALPHSEFLDQSHIGTVCTRVQFADGAGNGANCPPASIYGHVVATSPLVDYAVEGPAILRSSSNELPDLVLALHGPPFQPLAFEAVARVDSIHGGIRSTFEDTPDLPLTKVVLQMEGGKKGLLENSTNICKGTHKATGKLTGQNGKTAELRPALKPAKCSKAKKSHRRRAAR